MTVAGGYFLTRAAERADCFDASLLPERVLSLSECIVDFVPWTWSIAWVDIDPEARRAEAAQFGLDDAALARVVAWATSRISDGSLGWPAVFWTAEDARAFAHGFLPDLPDLRLLGIGLAAADVEAFLAETRPGPDHGVPGVYAAASRRLELEPGGAPLGWEVLCYDHGGFHSWLCNGLERDALNRLAVRPAGNGFIADPEDARAVARYCGRDDVGAEPGFWASWLVCEYPLIEEDRPRT